MALYYTVDVEYYSGLATTGTPLTTDGAQADDTVLLACDTIGSAVPGLTAAAGQSLVVRCPANCADGDGPVYTDGAYLIDSSVCPAAIHAGAITSANGGAFRVTLSAGAANRGTWLQSACTACWACWQALTLVLSRPVWLLWVAGQTLCRPALWRAENRVRWCFWQVGGQLPAPPALCHALLTAGRPRSATWLPTGPLNGGVTPDVYWGDLAANLNMAFEAVGALPAHTTFTVMRWGGTNRVARLEGSGENLKLVLPIDLSKGTNCGAVANSPCGRGKYLVTSVTAYRWTTGGSFTSDSAGTKPSTARINPPYTFVGEELLSWHASVAMRS